MEVVSNNYMPGDPRLVQQLVYELKSQGIFDQFRKECIADVDTKPAYQNLRQRVEGSVTSFLKQQTWRPDMNKNQVREQLRKSIYESGYLETGVERIVDQVVNPKINTVFLPQVEDVVYRYLGIEKPNRMEIKKELKIDVTDLLPTDLEAVSPESDHTKDDNLNLNDSLNTDSKLEEDESPPFEPLDVQQNDVQHEENSVDSHLSGFSGLQSHDSNPCNEAKMYQMELSNQDSQVSHNSSESHLSIITSEDNTKMEVCEEPETKLLKSNDLEAKIENSIETCTNSDKNSVKNDTQEINDMEKIEPEQIEPVKNDEKIFAEKKPEEKKVMEKKNDDKKFDEKKNEDKKPVERKNDDKKSRTSEKHSSRDKKEDKYRKSSSTSSSRDKEKTSSRHSSSSSSKDKDKKDLKTNSSSNKDKEKVEKDKDKPEKERSEKERPKSDKDRERGDRDKSKNSNSSKHSNNKDKDKNHSNSKKESSSKDKEKSRSSSSSASNQNKSKSHSESKSRSSTDKHKKNDKSSHNGKYSSNSSSLKKDKDKKRDVKKESKDDHYSNKEKKNDRRSTDRDSNDGQSSRQSQSNSFTESSSSQTQKNSQESSNSNSRSGSGDSGNSDQTEHTKVISPIKLSSPTAACADIQKFKYMKPKFASNFEEARKLMKIRKQLAKLERQNQLSLTQIEVSVEIPNGIAYPEENFAKEIDKVEVDKEVANSSQELKTVERKETISSPKEEVAPMLQSTELSKENWEALEARLAQEMSNINYDSYESPYDYDYDYGGYSSVVISPRKNTIVADDDMIKEDSDKTKCSKSYKLDFGKDDDVISPQKNMDIMVESSKPLNQEEIIKNDLKNNVEKKRKLRVELEATIYKSTKGVVKIIEKKEKITKNGDKTKQNLIKVQKLVKSNQPRNERENVNHVKMDIDIIHKSEENLDVSDADYECRYLEIPSHSMENNLQFIRSYIKKLEQDVEQSIKTFQNNFVSLNKVGCKRKLEENVDVKNNNEAHYEQTTEMKKRRRSIARNPKSVISKANKEKMCNSTDISPNDSFSLPLSPAESDKSNDKKEDESPKLAKQKRNVIGRNTSTRSQRYSSDDLYKPRPIIIASTRRSRSAKNQGN